MHFRPYAFVWLAVATDSSANRTAEKRFAASSNGALRCQNPGLDEKRGSSWQITGRAATLVGPKTAPLHDDNSATFSLCHNVLQKAPLLTCGISANNQPLERRRHRPVREIEENQRFADNSLYCARDQKPHE
jgi:hypothetical protein